MAAKILDIVIEQGATFDLDFTWADTVNTNGVITQVPKNLTGCTARMQVRAGYGKTVMIDATTENGRITLGGTTGKVDITLSALLTDKAPLYINTNGVERVRKRAVYDLEVAWPDGHVDRVLQGKVTFAQNITRDARNNAGNVYVPNVYVDAYHDKY